MTQQALPTSMRAVHQEDKFAPDLTLVQTPVPVPSRPGEVLVKVAATALCYSELTWVGLNPEFLPSDKEPVPGQDIAGTVVQTSPNSAFKVGDEVYCRIDATRPGGLRDYTLALESELALKPASLDWISAAATPLSALTAWQAVFADGSGLEQGALFGDAAAKERNSARRVLITAAGGSVGGFATQFAAAAGAAAVVGVCSTDKVEQARSLGATHVVDYKEQGIDAWVRENPQEREFDVVVDCVGGDSMVALWAAVKDGGEILSVSDMPERLRPEGVKAAAKSRFFIVQSLGSQLAEISRLLEEGRVRPLVDSVYEFEHYQEAFDKLDKRSARGKIVVKVSV